jgi:hypothetical protein
MFFLKPNKNHSFLAEKEEYNKKIKIKIACMRPNIPHFKF